MSFTYDPSLPTPRDRIRSSTADIVSPGFRSDEQIDALVAAYGETEATALIAEGLAAEYALQPDSVSLPGGLSVSFKERVKSWADLAARLRADLQVQLVADRLSSHIPVRSDLIVEHTEYTRENGDLFPGPEYWVWPT